MKNLTSTVYLFVFFFCSADLTQAQSTRLDVVGHSKISGNLELRHMDDETTLHIGKNAGINTDFSTPPIHNSFTGFGAGQNNTMGTHNSFFGSHAGINNESGSYNSAFGVDANVGIDGTYNSSFGAFAGLQLTIGNYNSFFGSYAGLFTSSGGENSFFGAKTGEANTTGHANSFFGYISGEQNINGIGNSFFGHGSGQANTEGNENVFIGATSGVNNTTGSGNTFIGQGVGNGNVTGNNNTYLGKGATQATEDNVLNEAIAIGYMAKVDCSNCAVIGGTGAQAVKVGIGIDSPEVKLHIGGGGSSQILLENGGDILWENSSGAYKAVLSLHTDNNVYLDATTNATSDLIFRTGTGLDRRMRILDNGNVGIGTDAPGYKLQVGELADGSEARANAWNTLSDERWKTQLRPIKQPVEKLLSLNGYYYYWKDGKDKSRQVGLSAQEVERVLPEVVSTDGEGYKSIDYGKLSALLIEAMKDQQNSMVDQQLVIATQQEQIKELQAQMAEVKRLLKADVESSSED